MARGSNNSANASFDNIVTQRVRSELARMFAPVFAAGTTKAVVTRRKRRTAAQLAAAATGTTSRKTGKARGRKATS